MAYKMTAARAIEVLKLAGVPVAEIVNDPAAEDADLDNDILLSEIDKARSVILKPQFEGDFKKTENDAFVLRMQGTLSTALARKFNMSKKELETMKVPDMIDHVLNSYDDKFSKDTEGLRTQLAEQIASFGAKEDQLKAEKESAINEWKDKYIDRDITEALLEELKDAPLNKKTNRLDFA
jgi:hypothetical protein